MHTRSASAPMATKSEIKHAVEELWSVRVAESADAEPQGKDATSPFQGRHTRSSWKKAIVELNPEDRIVFF